MLSFNSLDLVLGGKELFNNISFTIHQNQKIGLVGANGSGKTSLFKIITNQLEVDPSCFSHSPNLRIAYLAQEVQGSDEKAIDYVISGDHELLKIKDQITIAEKNEQFELVATLYEQYSILDGYSANSRAQKLMHGLGFKEIDFNKSLNEFSGGWRVRLNLAKTLMQPSDLLLLDEPTNHLDLDAILWLANWIKHFKGALILISHDRDFLDDCVSFIAHLDMSKIDLYKGNFSQFEVLRSMNLAEIKSNYEKQQREIEHMKTFITRFKAKATKAKQAQSRVKSLERMKLIVPAHIKSPFKFSITATDKLSNPLIVFKEASLGYTSPVINNLELSISPGDRIGLLGSNGAGKSTLIKSIVGEIPVLKGEKEIGKNTNIGYFSQHQVDDLDLSISAFEHIQKLDITKDEKQIRKYLASFNFKGEKVLDRVNLFSGGEKARLAFAIIAYKKPNLLIMDEPTTHLDIEMRHALTVAIQNFEGAILLVSHDRYLLNSSVDFFYIVRDSSVKIFDGDLEDYRNYVLDKVSIKKTSDNQKSHASQTNVLNEKIRYIKKEIKQLEKRLERLNVKLKDANEKLADPSLYEGAVNDNLQNLIRNQHELTSELKESETLWLEKVQELEEIL